MVDTKRHDAPTASEHALRESEARFRELADNISQFAWTADQAGWIYWYNKRWLDYTGITLDEMQGSGWQKVHHPDHDDGMRTTYAAVAERLALVPLSSSDCHGDRFGRRMGQERTDADTFAELRRRAGR